MSCVIPLTKARSAKGGNPGEASDQMWWFENQATVDGSEIPFPTTWDVSNPVNNGIFTISTG